MNTNETKMERKKINHEIHLVSNYRALLIAKHIGTLLLILYFVPAAITGFDESPALYILLLHNILPAVFYLLFTNNSKSHTKNPRILKPSAYDEVKEEPKKTHTLSFIFAKEMEADTPILPQLKKKYQYSRLKYQSNSISFLLTCFFLYLWQQQDLIQNGFYLYQYAPVVILAVIVLTRFICIIFYECYIHNSLRFGGV
ncbi:hypothetical protein [Lachnoclostridium sp.]|uniref:hypothetical protein n=1 Tax=Lachnoclostridium sp. TaxID=2028282 RepID=UPI00289BBCD2|nr:hypothetical protein [Lachnoclostridium sp.]